MDIVVLFFALIPCFLIAVYTYSLLSELKTDVESKAYLRANKIKRIRLDKTLLYKEYDRVHADYEADLERQKQQERESNGGRSVSGGDS